MSGASYLIAKRDLGENSQLNIIGIYRSPNISTTSFVVELENILKKFGNINTLLIRDINIDIGNINNG